MRTFKPPGRPFALVLLLWADRTFFYLVTNTGEKMGVEVASWTLRNLRAGA